MTDDDEPGEEPDEADDEGARDPFGRPLKRVGRPRYRVALKRRRR
jgi:hypothetical protein